MQMRNKKRSKMSPGRVVFAIRLTIEEREKIHKAAGRLNATRWAVDALLKAAKKGK